MKNCKHQYANFKIKIEGEEDKTVVRCVKCKEPENSPAKLFIEGNLAVTKTEMYLTKKLKVYEIRRCNSTRHFLHWQNGNAQ